MIRISQVIEPPATLHQMSAEVVGVGGLGGWEGRCDFGGVQRQDFLIKNSLLKLIGIKKSSVSQPISTPPKSPVPSQLPTPPTPTTSALI